MMKRGALSFSILGAIAAISMAVAPTAASAQRWGGDRGWHDHYRGGGYGDRGYYRGGYERGYDRGHYDRGYYGYHHRCRDGAGGTVIGAIAGGLLGNAVAGYGDRTAGTIIGGGVGALAGRAIARDC
jgi:hypothetical protein